MSHGKPGKEVSNANHREPPLPTTPPQFDLGRSLSNALRALQQGPAATGAAAGQAAGSKTAGGSQPRPAESTVFQTQLKAAHDAGLDGQVRPRGSYVNFSV